MAVTRQTFEALGGFDERFIICGSDVEFCLKAHRHGLYNVMCAQARLVHHESKTRGREVPAVDFEMSAQAYEPYRTQSTDPYFSPHLSLAHRTPTLNPIG
jgi:GT2 family glycosyltransferase